jgi:outer membrane protein OmpA-like peptidoglycan-associated protein
LISLCSLAFALDLHGPPVVPPAGDQPAEPLTVWTPDSLSTVAVGTAIEWGDGLVVRRIQVGENTEDVPILDDVLGLSVVGKVPFGRYVGVAFDMPLFLTSNNADGRDGPATGDFRLAVPVAFMPDGPAGFGVGLVPELVLPSGAERRYLGAQGVAGGALLWVGMARGPVQWALNLGVQAARDPEVSSEIDVDFDRTASYRLGASLGWVPTPWLGLGVEATSSPSTRYPSDAPTEVLLRAGLSLPKGFSLSVAGGRAVLAAPGAASSRAYLRLGWAAARKKAAEPVPDPLPLPELPLQNPYELRIHVRDEQGAPLDATVTVTGQDSPLSTGEDGELSLELAPGRFQVDLAAPGRESQRRTVSLAVDRYRPADLDAVLPPAEGGATDLHLELLDIHGVPVEGVSVRIDGASRGATSTGGTLDLLDLQGGSRTITVEADNFEALAPATLSIQGDLVNQRLYLSRAPGTVTVVARTADAPVADAVVRFFGPEEKPPLELGKEGEQSLVLAPGTWTVGISAPSYGTQERELVIEPDSPHQTLEFLLQAEESGGAELLIRVVDPDGRPVEGALVEMDGHALGRTSSGGSLRVGGLQLGKRKILVSGDRMRPSEPREVELVAGLREVQVGMAWKPGSVELQARGPEGTPVDAAVRWLGDQGRSDSTLGPDGEAFYALEPGNWTLVLSSPTLGLQERQLVVQPDDVQRVEIVAELLRDEGDSRLELVFVDPDGHPAEGVEVRVNGRSVGRTSSGGTLSLEGLPAESCIVDYSSDRFAAGKKNLKLRTGENRLELRTEWGAARVRVATVTAEGPARDALVRMVGAVVLPPLPVGSDGTRLYSVDPGRWTVVASSERYGIGEEEVEVRTTGEEQPVSVRLEPPPPARAALLVEVVGPTGKPVEGLVVKVGREELPAVGGRVLLPELPLTPLSLSATAPGYAPLEEQEVPLVEGTQQRRFTMRWLPRVVRVRAADVAGVPLDARLSFLQGKSRKELSLGADGVEDVPLLPGTWGLLASAGDGLESLQRPVEVPPGGEVLELPLTLGRTRVLLTDAQVEIREQVFFSFDGAALDERSYPVLSEVAATLKLHPELRVRIEGHTDDVGNEAYNLDLSQRRAAAVRDWLIAAGVDPARLETQGFGNSRPLTPGSSERARQKNRRVAFQILTTATPPPPSDP